MLRGWTYAKSQKAKNLERDPRATLQIDDGVEYQELRGVMLECDVEVERDPERGRPATASRCSSATRRRRADAEAREMVRRRRRSASACASPPPASSRWDHRKLGGTY